jgi:hypothetical protein
MPSHPGLAWVVGALDAAGTSRRAASIRPTRTFVSHGHGTLMTPSFSGRSSSRAVWSAITGMLDLCGVLLPIAPRKASRRYVKGSMREASSDSSVGVQQGWGQSIPAKNCGLVLPLLAEVLGSQILGNLSRFSARSHTSLSTILVIRTRPDRGRGPYRCRYRVNQGE